MCLPRNRLRKIEAGMPVKKITVENLITSRLLRKGLFRYPPSFGGRNSWSLVGDDCCTCTQVLLARTRTLDDLLVLYSAFLALLYCFNYKNLLFYSFYVASLGVSPNMTDQFDSRTFESCFWSKNDAIRQPGTLLYVIMKSRGLTIMRQPYAVNKSIFPRWLQT